MTKKLKLVCPDFSNTAYAEDIKALDDCFADLKSQKALRKVGIDANIEKSIIDYKKDLYAIKTICQKYPNDKKIVQMLQNNLSLVGSAIHGTGNMDVIVFSSDFLTDMGRILTSGKVSPKNQFLVAYGLGKAVENSGYNIYTKMQGTFSDDENTLLGVILKDRNFPCIAALSEVLERRFVKIDIGKFNLSAKALDGVFFAVNANNCIDMYTKKSAMTMLAMADRIKESQSREIMIGSITEKVNS